MWLAAGWAQRQIDTAYQKRPAQASGSIWIYKQTPIVQ